MRMSPILFNLYLAEIDEKIKERGIGDVGIKLGYGVQRM